MRNKGAPKLSLAKFLRPYWFMAIISPLFMVGEVLIDLLQPKLMSKIVNEGVLGSDMELIITTGLQMLGLVAVGGAMGLLCAYTASVASQGFGNDLRKASYNRVMHLSLGQTDKFTTGSLVTRLTNDISTLQDFVAMILRMFIRAPISLIGATVLCLGLNVNFGYVLLIGIPVMLVIVVIMLVRANPLFTEIQKRLDRVNSVVQENVTGARVIKAYTREEYEIDRFNTANTEYKNTSMKVSKLLSFIMPLMMIIMNASVIAVIYIGGLQVEAKAMNVGDVMAAATYITNILMSIMMVSMMFQQISRSKACGDRVKEVLAAEPDITGGSASDAPLKGAVEFKNVSFSYPNSASGSGAHSSVLSGVSLKINKGETVAVIGATGSGKTSLVNLIARFYDVTEGAVLVDGMDVREYDLDSLRGKIGFVLQKSELFSGTVKENLLWGKPDATDEEIVRAAKIAQADGFITSFTDGYESYIAEKGASLSGGQKQRMSIARAIIRQPEILIFDDSTSALDLGTEARLQAALRENLRGTTVIMIAQRIASVKNADKIAVIENGSITAFGSHDELMKTSAAYQDIYASQMKSADGGEAQ